MKVRKAFALLILGLYSTVAGSDEIHIAVASNFTAAMQDIAAIFEKQSGHTVKATFGSSGKLYAQIRNRAPFQVFFSADAEKPLALEKNGLTVPGTRFTYAAGRLALWSAEPGLPDVHEILMQGRFHRLAIANPRHAPYGAAALQVLRHLGIAGKAQNKLVQGQNIAQAYQFVESGNAQLGLVALSQIKYGDRIKQGSAWLVPAAMHDPLRQDGVLLKAGMDNKAAQALLLFMRDAQARSLIAAHGYQTGAD